MKPEKLLENNPVIGSNVTSANFSCDLCMITQVYHNIIYKTACLDIGNQ